MSLFDDDISPDDREIAAILADLFDIDTPIQTVLEEFSEDISVLTFSQEIREGVDYIGKVSKLFSNIEKVSGGKTSYVTILDTDGNLLVLSARYNGWTYLSIFDHSLMLSFPNENVSYSKD